jgi:hypothetical protein
MVDPTVRAAADAARTKTENLRRQPLGCLILSALAGVYVGWLASSPHPVPVPVDEDGVHDIRTIGRPAVPFRVRHTLDGRPR